MDGCLTRSIHQKYLFGYKDADGNYLDGSKNYELHIPPKVPVKDFPSIGSQALPGTNPDGSIDIYFGPKPPKGKEKFWLETLPGKGWFPVFGIKGEGRIVVRASCPVRSRFVTL